MKWSGKDGGFGWVRGGGKIGGKAQGWKFSCLLMAHLWIDWAKKSKMGGKAMAGLE